MQKKYNNLTCLSLVFLILIIASCTIKPQPIKMGDTCDFCMMGVADDRFGAELITKKGKIYKFDDIHCLLGFMKANKVPKEEQKTVLFVDFEAPHGFLKSANVALLKSEALRSPMGSNIAAFKNQAQLKQTQNKLRGEKVDWQSLASK